MPRKHSPMQLHNAGSPCGADAPVNDEPEECGMVKRTRTSGMACNSHPDTGGARAHFGWTKRGVRKRAVPVPALPRSLNRRPLFSLKRRSGANLDNSGTGHMLK